MKTAALKLETLNNLDIRTFTIDGKPFNAAFPMACVDFYNSTHNERCMTFDLGTHEIYTTFEAGHPGLYNADVDETHGRGFFSYDLDAEDIDAILTDYEVYMFHAKYDAFKLTDPAEPIDESEYPYARFILENCRLLHDPRILEIPRVQEVIDLAQEQLQQAIHDEADKINEDYKAKIYTAAIDIAATNSAHMPTGAALIKLADLPDSGVMCELFPTDGHKSFYKKATVKFCHNGAVLLYSYDTPIIKITPQGEMLRLWDKWSYTTGRHIKAFSGLRKAQYLALPLEKIEVESKPLELEVAPA